MVDTGIPLVDLGPWFGGETADRQVVADQVDAALVEYGFMMVINAGVPVGLPGEVRASVEPFFALPEMVKARYRVRVGAGPGWIPFGGEANSYAKGVESPPDMKETFKTVSSEGPGAFSAVWPAETPGLEAPVTRYLEVMRSVQAALLEVCAAALAVPPATFRGAGAEPKGNLNINHYPPMTDLGTPAPGQYRIGAHTDFGTLTLLDRQPGYGGLQVETRAGEWIDAPYVPGALTVNVGDLLERWTGDRWRSTSHRVLPPDPRDARERLISLIYFGGVDDATMVQTLEVGGPNTYPPVNAGQYVGAKIRAIDVA